MSILFVVLMTIAFLNGGLPFLLYYVFNIVSPVPVISAFWNPVMNSSLALQELLVNLGISWGIIGGLFFIKAKNREDAKRSAHDRAVEKFNDKIEEKLNPGIWLVTKILTFALYVAISVVAFPIFFVMQIIGLANAIKNIKTTQECFDNATEYYSNNELSISGS